MRRNPRQGLWTLALWGFAAGLVAVWHEWGEWAALGTVLLVVATVVALRRGGVTGPRLARRGAGQADLGLASRATEAPAAGLGDQRQTAEEAFGAGGRRRR